MMKSVYWSPLTDCEYRVQSGRRVMCSRIGEECVRAVLHRHSKELR